jgi:hypothetical protein
MMPSQLIWKHGRLTSSETPFLTGLDGTVKFEVSTLMTGRVATKMDSGGIQCGLVYVEQLEGRWSCCGVDAPGRSSTGTDGDRD